MEVDTSPTDTFVIAAQQANAPWNDEAGRLNYKGYLHLVGGNVRHHCEILKKYINYKLKTTLINRVVNRLHELNSF